MVAVDMRVAVERVDSVVARRYRLRRVLSTRLLSAAAALLAATSQMAAQDQIPFFQLLHRQAVDLVAAPLRLARLVALAVEVVAKSMAATSILGFPAAQEIRLQSVRLKAIMAALAVVVQALLREVVAVVLELLGLMRLNQMAATVAMEQRLPFLVRL